MMPFTKVIGPDAYDYGESTTALVKFSRRGLAAHDRDVLTKRAGHALADQLSRLMPAPGEDWVHLIAVGATERFSANKNGDGFKEAVCRKYHPTFVKLARWYRHHDNRNPAKSYGIVKLSSFNEDMRRIELIVALNATKEAAERNGGLVADREMEKLARGLPIGVSMSCTVPDDHCSSCGNVARNRGEYCLGVGEGGHCKHGGLRHHIGRLCEDGHRLHADNLEPSFFDISNVDEKPADPTAWVLGRVKEASGRAPCGAELAEAYGSVGTEDLFVARLTKAAAVSQARLLFRLHDLESVRAAGSADPVADAFAPRVFLGKAASVPPGTGPARALEALTRRGAMLSPEGFLSLIDFGGVVGWHKGAAAQVRAALPGSFRRLADREDMEEILADSPYAAGRFLALRPEDEAWAKAAAAGLGVRRRDVTDRLVTAGLRGVKAAPVKSAGAPDASGGLADQYALYQLSVLDHPLLRGDDFAAGAVVSHNFTAV